MTHRFTFSQVCTNEAAGMGVIGNTSLEDPKLLFAEISIEMHGTNHQSDIQIQAMTNKGSRCMGYKHMSKFLHIGSNGTS